MDDLKEKILALSRRLDYLDEKKEQNLETLNRRLREINEKKKGDRQNQQPQ